MKRDPNVVFEGSIPENYERYLGPVLFQPFATDLAARLKSAKPKIVLEIACGTGIVTRILCDRLGPGVRIVATDLNPGMLAFAKKKLAADADVKWQEADAAELPFQNGSFDAVVCQFGLMFVPDKQAAMREAYRVLSPGGAFFFNVWDAMERNPFARIAHETIASFFTHDPPTFYQIPFNLHDCDLVRSLLEKAGFKSIESSEVALSCRSPSADAFAIGLVRGNPVSTAIQERGIDMDKVIDAVSRSVAEHFGEAPVESTMQAFVWQTKRD